MNKRIWGTALSILIALSFSWLPARAEVEVSDTVGQTSEVVSVEETAVTKDISLTTTQVTEVDHSAMSSGMVTATSNDNQVTESRGIKSAHIGADSLTESTGIISINQAPGSLNNQNNAVTVTLAGEGADSLLQATSALQNSTSGNKVIAVGSEISNTILDNAFFGVRGIITVNQSAGSINTQSALINVSIGSSPVVSLSDADLGMQNANNRIIDIGVSRIDSISTFALQGVKGIVSINQSSGCLNHQANVVSVSLREITLY